MNRAALFAVVLNFMIIGGLPVFFFRRDGKLNLMWWLTGGPFFICPLVLLGAYFGAVPISPRFSTLLGPYQDLLALPFSVASMAMIFLTLGTHRIPIALWHQGNDAPRHIVTYGAYRFIRHPFYSSFLLAFAAATLLLPHPVILAFALYVLLILNLTAAGEEKKLQASELGSEYQAYMMRTGRFFPRWSRGS
jgi:protein-S-isoprenylcysteine O-methyltransferase Ste14